VVIQTLGKLKATQSSPGTGTVSFADFKPFVSKIRDCEVAVRHACNIAITFPCGEDRIAAYKMAQLFTEKWIKSLARSDVFHFNPECRLAENG
jgi:hypothetical protein